MDRIRVLPDGVANQIAAGEVVVRPASVIKELMENAVDAGASSVTVNFRDGGREMMQVVDNGCGMSPGDARLAFDRHATSKIKVADDLYKLTSFGFRGEALPSIASVSEMELGTREPDAELGVQIRISGGKFENQRDVQIPQGTQFTVRNLFYNLPARKRFLKDAATETRHIVTEFQRVALCNPEVAFTLCNNQSQIFNLPASNLRQRIVGLIGKPIATNLLEVSVDTSMIRIEGYVGRPAAAKKTNREQYLFVNGRYFRSPYFHKAVLQAYEKLVPADMQPSYFLYFTVAPDRIDVNIHPTKTEIRFDDEQALWQIVNAAVRESLGKTGVVPMMDFEMDSSLSIPVFREQAPCKFPGIGVNPDFNPFNEDYESFLSGREKQSVSSGGRAGAGAEFPGCRRTEVPGDWEALYNINSRGAGDKVESGSDSLREIDSSAYEFITGQEPTQGVLDIESGSSFKGLLPLGGRYIATALGGSLVILDAARVRERVFYERYLRMLGNNSAVSQQLLFPEKAALAPDDFALFTEREDDFYAVGFEFARAEKGVAGGADVGSGIDLEITGIPGDLPVSAAAETLHAMLSELREWGRIDPRERVERLAAVMARETAGRTSRDLNETEATTLIDELMTCDNFNYAPSGLPLMTVIGVEEIARRFRKPF